MRIPIAGSSAIRVFAAVFGILFFCAAQADAQQRRGNQFPSDFWNNGKLVLDNGDTLTGKLKYNLDSDLLMFQSGVRNETFTPRKVVFFEIFDQIYRRFRQFYALPYAPEGQYKTPVFFELMEEGRLTLLARERVEAKTYSSGYYYGSYTRMVLVNYYFFLKENGTVTAFTGNKGDLYDLMGTRGEAVKDYAKENKLSFDEKYGFGGIVHYYNTLK